MISLLIHRMTASFGKLQGQTLELKDGLNIIQAPNETGKSTWCAFILAMLYGINSRERDRAGFIAEKNRYAPWNGTAMSGRMDCRYQGEGITLTRATRRQTAPMAEFKAVYTGTGTDFPGLSAQACGESLLGVSREVYERSAFIRQSGLSITQDAGLERRIASLITTGEEDTSYSEVSEILKKQLNRRRHNKTGQIPALEAELQAIRQQLAELSQLENQLQAARMQIEQYTLQEVSYSAELEQHALWETARKQQALIRAETAAQNAAQSADALRQQLESEHIPELETIGRLRGALVNLETTRKTLEKARSDRDEAAKAALKAKAAANDSPFAGQTPDNARKIVSSVPRVRPVNPWLSVLPVVLGAAIAFLISGGSPIWWMAVGGGVGLLAALIVTFTRLSGDKKKQLAYLRALGADTPEQLDTRLNTYLGLYEAAEAAQAELDRHSAAVDTLYNTLSANEQAILLEVRRFAPSAFDSSSADAALRECAHRHKLLAEADSAAAEACMRYDLMKQQVPHTSVAAEATPPQRDKQAVLDDLNTSRRELAVARSAADRLSGQLESIGDPAVLRSAAMNLEEELEQRNNEYNAIRLAMESLDQANTTLQNRFSPALGKRAAEIFHELTDGRYKGVVLDRSFHLSAEPAGDTIYRDAQLLSAGTIDQLYLATRLAICDLVLPAEYNSPIILDDALANFDDTRCAAALRWLKTAAGSRQILLFTCHSREAAFFANDKEVFVQQLTNVI